MKQKAQFDFSFPYNLYALIVNPFYFVRKNLYKNIKLFSGMLHGRLLDFGCGCKPYIELFEKCTEYIGVDIEESGHDHTNEKVDIFYDGKILPFMSESFDSIFSSEVCEHVLNIDEIMIEINRVLKMGGYLLVTVPFVWNEHEIPYDFQRFTSYGISKLLEKYGFQVVEQKKSTNFIEMLFQMWMEYLRGCFKHYRIARVIVQTFLIFPTACIGNVLSFILPSNYSLYGDNIVLCKKVGSCQKEDFE